MTRRQWLMTMGLLPAAGAVADLATRKLGWQGGPTRHWRQEPARAQFQRAHLPNLPLVTHRGDRVHFYDDLVKDRKVLINFIDTHQTPAAVVTPNLADLQRILRARVGRDIFMYSITTTPQHDTPEVLNAWANRHDAGPGWLFLTGQPAHVQTLRQALGFSFADRVEDRDPWNVMSILRHGNEPEMRWAYCPAQASPRQLALTVVGDFGPDPSQPRGQWYCTLAAIQA